VKNTNRFPFKSCHLIDMKIDKLFE